MLTLSEARSRVAAKLAAMRTLADDEWVIMDEHTIERNWGWVFFYQTRRWVETCEPSAALAGNAPIIVNRHDGSLHSTGTDRPIEEYIDIYEKHQTSTG